MKIRPLHDRVLVKRLEEQESRRGGIIIPDTAKEKPQHAEVMGVGSGKISPKGERFPPCGDCKRALNWTLISATHN